MPLTTTFCRFVTISALFVGSALFTSAFAQLPTNCAETLNGNFTIEIDTIHTNIGVITNLLGETTDLTGYNTYRLYITTEAEDDLLQAVSGDSATPTTITTTTTFYQHPLGNNTESGYNEGFFAAYAEMEYDSFLTIGLDQPAIGSNGEEATEIVEDESATPISTGFANGQSLIIDSFIGSAWYVTASDFATNANAGADKRILFAQVTTDGDLDGLVQFQVYRNGDQDPANCLRPYLPVNPLNDPGCTDETACNFDASAFVNDGSCDFCSCADTSATTTLSFVNDIVPEYALDVELFADLDTTDIASLQGYKTYRLYVNLNEAGDRVSAVYGNSETPLDIQTTTTFAQASLGAVTPSNILPLYYSIQPESEYDSWVTIGIERAASEYGGGYQAVSSIADPAASSSWIADFDPGNGQFGGNILANTNVGGTWFVTNPTSDNTMADADGRVLIAQFTTDGILSGTLGVQILPETLPENDNEYRLSFTFSSEGLGESGFPDEDGDGVCDGNEVQGCTDAAACNYDSTPTTDTDNTLCQYATGCDTCSGATDGTGTVIDNDADNDGVCDVNEVQGCTDAAACNYDSTPTTDTDNTLCQYATGCDTCSGATDGTGTVIDNDADNDGVCDVNEVQGCTDAAACNYDSTPTTDTDNTLCQYATGCDTCSGATDGTGTVIDNDADNDGVCDGNEVQGCTDAAACNYDSTPTTDTDNTLCQYATGCDTCSGATDGTGTVIDNDADNDGVCDGNEVQGCTDAAACNYDSTPTTDTDNTLCQYATGCDTCSGATDGTGTVIDNDADNDGVCDGNEVEGCTDATACNYDSTPTTDTNNSLCTYVDGICETCINGVIVDNDTDNDNVCDGNEIPGCQVDTACNYNALATDDDGSCIYVDGVCDTCVDGQIVDNDADNDGVCDDNEVEGCTDPAACNYDSTPTTDTNNTLCTYVDGVCDTCVDGLIVDNDADNDGVCDDNEVEGCTDATACNYDSDPTTDTNNTLCTYVDGICDTCVDGLIVDNDADNDGVCDDNEVEGCTDATACNYDSTPTTDTNNTLCTYVDGICDTCVDGLIVDNDADNDGVCDDNEVEGCTDATACNYDSTPTTDTNNTLCTFVDGICDTCVDGLIVDNDADNDGVCDGNEVEGCTDPAACNYDSTPTTDTNNTLCTYVDGVCDTCVDGLIVDNDADNDGVCDNDEVQGCTDPAACNYDSTPTTDTNNTLCTYVDGVCDTCVDGQIVDNDADNDGVCDDNEVEGCTDATACNYDSDPTTDTNNTLCTYVDGVCDTCVDGLIVDNDADNDGVCDDNEVQGCTDATACNYDSTPTTDTNNTLCTYVDGVCDTCVDGQIVDNDADNDGVCDDNEVEGCTDATACNYDSDPTTDTNNTLCTYVDGVCDTCVDGQIVDNDADNDGVCDDNEVQGCTDATACNYDSDPTTDTNNTLCTYVDGVCDTCVDGLIVDNDADNDGVCDDNEVEGCTDATACNYDSDPTTDTNNTLCTYVDGVCDTCVDGLIVDNDADNDGVCDDNEVEGCTDATACNYDSDPTTDTNNTLCTYVDGVCDTCVDGLIVDNDADNDGVCDDNEVEGCTDATACNYDSDPTTDTNNTLCTYVDGVCDTCVDGLIVDNDADNDGVCDDNEVEGCTDATACNYDSDPTTDTNNTLCTYVDGVCDTCVDGLIVDNDADNDGVCDDNEVQGCTDPAACNYDSDPTTDTNNTLCTYVTADCESCINGQVILNDADEDGICDEDEVAGCTDPSACNAGDFTDTDNSLCAYADDNCESCLNGSVILSDADNDGVCDENEVEGCTDATACNYDSTPTTDTNNTLCTYVDGVCDTCVDGLIVDNDADNDGVCDDIEVQGCTDPEACNYDSDPTTDTNNTLCTYVDGICETCVDGLIVDNDADNDGVCDDNEVQGCTDPEACNYDSNPTTDTDNTLCTYVDGICETCVDGQIVDNDTDNDGVCNSAEAEGCTDPEACNYDSDPTTDTDNTLCTYVDGVCDTCVDGLIFDNDADNDGVCDDNEVEGCTDATACNYDSDPTTDTNNTLCTYVDGVCDTCVDGLIVDNDADNDGVCDDNEVEGCTDATACNYDSDPTTNTNNTLCTYVDGVCDTCVDGQIVDNDADNDGVCDGAEVQGCTDPAACNYDSDPTTDTDNTLCTYVDGVCETCVDGQIVDNDADNDGVCDGAEAEGCTDPEACNYDSDPTTDTNNTLCTYVDGICETCVDGLIVDNDADNDGVCDDNEVEGCTDATACNYDSDPTTDTNNTLCTYVDGVCDTCVDGLIVDNDADNDGVCDDNEVEGCTDATACNYDSDPTTDTNNTLCTYVDGVCDTCVDGLIVDNDADNDGVCDDNEVEGCTDATACNYDSDPTTDTNNTLCTYVDGVCDTCVDGLIVDNDADNDGVCDDNEVEGCTDATACNYDSDPTTDTNNTLCTYVDGVCDTCVDGQIVDNDADNDGVCDGAEVQGCTDPAACNYDSDPTTDTNNTLCTYVDGVCETCVNGEIVDNDANDNGICDNDEVECPDFNNNDICDGDEIFGCTYGGACNFDLNATADDGSCVYANPGFDCDGNDLGGADLFYGCTYPEALNYSAAADIDNGSCTFLDVITDIGPCYFDVTNDGVVNTPDLLILLQYWESTCVE